MGHLSSQDHPKAVCRGPTGTLEGVALLLTEGHATDIGFLHIMPRFASDLATGALLDTALGAAPASTTKVRAQVANAGRWLHVSPARSRALLADRGFTQMSRALMLRDLRKMLPPVPPVPAGYTITSPEPTRFEEWAHFAFTAYKETTDFAVITLEETEAAYLRLYRRFLGGEFGPYARGMSFAALPDGGGPPVGVLHTVFVGPDPYVGDLSLLPGHRGRGVGRYLLLAALAAYAASGATRTGLTATEQNRPAFTLYRSAGFEVARTNDVFVRYA
jgi:ribosomal protein S18 acetylase RimI-like enzyme